MRYSHTHTSQPSKATQLRLTAGASLVTAALLCSPATVAGAQPSGSDAAASSALSSGLSSQARTAEPSEAQSETLTHDLATITLTVANPQAGTWAEGDTIEYTLTLTNNSDVARAFAPQESNLDGFETCKWFNLGAGESAECTGHLSHTVTAEDVAAGSFTPSITYVVHESSSYSAPSTSLPVLSGPSVTVGESNEEEQPLNPPFSADPSLEARLTEPMDLATPNADTASYYRIPSLTVAPNGDVLASYDLRPGSAADTPNPNSIIQRRSTDNGKTWGEETVIAAGVTEGDTVSYSDPSYVVDNESGTIFNFHVKGFDSGFFQGRYTRNEDGSIKEDDRGSMQLHLAVSKDNGHTWENRVITDQVLRPHEDVVSGFATSGGGIQIQHGPHAGRLVQPFAWLTTDNDVKAATVYSDDGGETWQRGELTSRVDDEGTEGYVWDENKVVELADGRLMINSRTSGGPGLHHRIVAYSSDGGVTWTNPKVEDQLEDPVNNAHIIRAFPQAEAGTPESEVLLFSNAKNGTSTAFGDRNNGSITVSCDSGETWDSENATQFFADYVGYSSMAVQKDGSIGLLSEVSGSGIRYQNFTLAALGTQCPGVQ